MVPFALEGLGRPNKLFFIAQKNWKGKGFFQKANDDSRMILSELL